VRLRVTRSWSNTQGIFAVDLLPQHNFKTLPRALIVNVSTHDQVSFHWVALFIVDTRKAEFFDSYGIAPSQYSKYFSEFFQTGHHQDRLQYKAIAIGPDKRVWTLRTVLFTYEMYGGVTD
jgi:hypothetical protein